MSSWENNNKGKIHSGCFSSILSFFIDKLAPCLFPIPSFPQYLKVPGLTSLSRNCREVPILEGGQIESYLQPTHPDCLIITTKGPLGSWMVGRDSQFRGQADQFGDSFAPRLPPVPIRTRCNTLLLLAMIIDRLDVPRPSPLRLLYSLIKRL